MTEEDIYFFKKMDKRMQILYSLSAILNLIIS